LRQTYLNAASPHKISAQGQQKHAPEGALTSFQFDPNPAFNIRRRANNILTKPALFNRKRENDL
jgi:hypothetical protein